MSPGSGENKGSNRSCGVMRNAGPSVAATSSTTWNLYFPFTSTLLDVSVIATTVAVVSMSLCPNTEPMLRPDLSVGAGQSRAEPGECASMDLPVMPPVSPMLAKSVPEIPDVGHAEPKWDGFRTIVFRDGDEVVLGSRNERPMTRYFPELVEAIKEETSDRCVLDGEIVVAVDDRLEFEALQQRIPPADSRVRMLAEQTPAAFIGFDMLADGDDDLMRRPFSERRERLTEALSKAGQWVFLTPATTDLATAQEWFDRFEGAGLDGIVAKPTTITYQPDKRVMFKIRNERTADCVVAGYRHHGPSTPS